MIIIMLIVFIYIDFNMKPVIMSIAESRARILGVQAINNAAYEIISEYSPLSYSALIDILQDAEGRVAMLQANTMRMNEIGTQTALRAQEKLDELTYANVRIPLGAATGSKMLAGRGPSITVTLVPIGAVSTEFKSEFTSAGINQTRHRIYIVLKATVRVVIPTASTAAEVSTQVQIAESIIVGQVPSTFADIPPIGILDLLP